MASTIRIDYERARARAEGAHSACACFASNRRRRGRRWGQPRRPLARRALERQHQALTHTHTLASSAVTFSATSSSERRQQYARERAPQEASRAFGRKCRCARECVHLGRCQRARACVRKRVDRGKEYSRLTHLNKPNAGARARDQFARLVPTATAPTKARRVGGKWRKVAARRTHAHARARARRLELSASKRKSTTAATVTTRRRCAAADSAIIIARTSCCPRIRCARAYWRDTNKLLMRQTNARVCARSTRSERPLITINGRISVAAAALRARAELAR